MLRHVSFSHEGAGYRELEHYFAARINDAVDPATDGWTAVERRSIQEHRWWTIDALRRTTGTVFPENLASLVADLWVLRQHALPTP